MKIVIFGATGMVGQGVLRECLADPAVTQILVVGRVKTGLANPRLEELILADVGNLEAIEDRLAGFDACFFPLGVSSAGMTEAAYEHITYTLTLKIAQILSRLNPGMTFIYVSGVGTDSSEKGHQMWARVKGRTENALLQLPLKAFLFRPGFIQPLDGIQSRTPLYRWIYTLTTPLLPLLRSVFSRQILTTREMGQAMLDVAKHGYSKPILEISDIRAVLGS